MSTRDALRDEIILDIARSSTDNTAVENAIARAIRFYQPKRFYFNETRSVTFNTVASTRAYTWAGATPDITTEFYTIDQAWVTDSGTEHELDQEDVFVLERMNEAPTNTNRPTDWGYIARSLVLHPTPDAIYSTRLAGHIKLAAPASGSETHNGWMIEAYDLLLCSAKVFLGLNYLHDTSLVAEQAPLEERELKKLEFATMTRAAPGYIVATDF